MHPLDLPFSRAAHDRAAHRRAEPDLVAALRDDPTTGVLVVHRGRLAVVGHEAPRAALLPAAGLPDGLWLFLGESDGAAHLALVLPETDDPPPPAGAQGWAGLRDVAQGQVDALAAGDLAARLVHGLAVEAVALAGWHATHRRCGRCGEPTAVVQAGWARHCPVDARETYPRTDPAVIMAVVDDADRLLLGHAATWPEGRFSTLAGFVEAGEGLEDTVRREVAEETGVVVGTAPGDVVYRASQAWPFPASLMLGFRARAVGTAVQTDDEEVTEARWFTRAELAAAASAGEVSLPGRHSIARALIEEWYGEGLPGSW
ncbi:NAD(+) diphosphatase [Isoptericola sp. S6320L]|uniref:NAD(+) diphosphatase n=1 Tax=Isoptericola sp. S6320L TaxID=2926411 RepID=UPI001FF1A84C|nr:NAD(+) diphosphatase [Isoptericola sp. S6320L]MCK0117400.1 NAD(+) diphosphatase [Isoptericola sp. S6320L]